MRRSSAHPRRLDSRRRACPRSVRRNRRSSRNAVPPTSTTSPPPANTGPSDPVARTTGTARTVAISVRVIQAVADPATADALAEALQDRHRDRCRRRGDHDREEQRTVRPTAVRANPAGTASATTSSVPRAAGRIELRIAASRRGRWVPTTNISMANPTSDRNAVVGSAGSIHSRPVRPSSTPAAISPTTSGNTSRGSPASSGPASPAATMSASSPKLTRALWARRATSRSVSTAGARHALRSGAGRLSDRPVDANRSRSSWRGGTRRR